MPRACATRIRRSHIQAVGIPVNIHFQIAVRARQFPDGRRLPLAADDLARVEALVGRAEQRERVVAVARVRRPAERDSKPVRAQDTLESHAHAGSVIGRRAGSEDGELVPADPRDLVSPQEILLEAVAEANGIGPAGGEPEKPLEPPPERFEVVVECQDESEQRELFDRLTREGLSCRVLTY